MVSLYVLWPVIVVLPDHTPLFYKHSSKKGFVDLNRRMAENGFAPPPPLGNFADISYLVENQKPSLLRDVCTLCSKALVCKSM